MSDVLSAVVSWQALLLALLVFGFAPGFVLHLIVLLYPKTSPRRRELLGELPNIPRWERPFQVVEWLGLALFEGPRERADARRQRQISRPSGTWVSRWQDRHEVRRIVRHNPFDHPKSALLHVVLQDGRRYNTERRRLLPGLRITPDSREWPASRRGERRP